MPYSPSPRGGRSRGKFPQSTSADEHRINDRIRVPEVRLIDHEGNQVGVVQTRRALDMAREVSLDLVEVSPNSRPPVCKILDYGKFKYEKKKKEHAAKKKQAVIKVKEIQVRPTTDVHDRDVKFRRLIGFLEDGDKVKITMLFRGREIAHPEQGKALMEQIMQQASEYGTVESRPKMEGRKMIMILAPLSSRTAAGKASKPKKDSAPEPSKGPDKKSAAAAN